MTKRECELCRQGLDQKDASIVESLEQGFKGLRRELTVAVGVSTSLTAIFISVLGLLTYFKVI